MHILRTWVFRWWEIGVVKLCLISFGVIISYYFGDALFRFMTWWWVIFIVTAAYFIVKWVREERKDSSRESVMPGDVRKM